MLKCFQIKSKMSLSIFLGKCTMPYYLLSSRNAKRWNIWWKESWDCRAESPSYTVSHQREVHTGLPKFWSSSWENENYYIYIYHIYACTYICICACICTYMHAHTNIQCICTYICIHTYINICMPTHTHIYIHKIIWNKLDSSCTKSVFGAEPCCR